VTENYPVALLVSLACYRFDALERAHESSSTNFDKRFWTNFVASFLGTSAWQNICGRLSNVRPTFSSLGFPEFNTVDMFYTSGGWKYAIPFRLASVHAIVGKWINLRAPVDSCHDRTM